MIDIGKIDWTKLKLAKSGRVVRLLYDKEPLQFCTSSLYTPFGVKEVSKQWSNFSELNLDCSLNQSTSESSVAFRDFIGKLDEEIQKLVDANPAVFANPNPKAEPVSSSYTYAPILRENGSYPKLMRLQLPRDKNGNLTSFVFDEDRSKIMIDDDNVKEHLVRGKVFKCIIECAKVYMYNGRVGSIWNIVQLKFSQNTKVQSAAPTSESMYSSNMMIDD